MSDFKVTKTIEQINKKIADGEAVVVTAEEIIDIARKEGVVEAAKRLTWLPQVHLPLCVLQVHLLILVNPNRRFEQQKPGSTMWLHTPAWLPWIATLEQLKPVRMTH